MVNFDMPVCILGPKRQVPQKNTQMKAHNLLFVFLPIAVGIQILHNAENGDFENVGILQKNFTENVEIYNFSVCSWFNLNFAAKRHSSIWVLASYYQLYNKGVCKLAFPNFEQF